ncbi:MAG: S9 family peptidase [Acidobacteria bacterium]|nr:S9 family peptidase [Acidobacteriota bacterium]
MKPIRHLLIGAACLCLFVLTLFAQTKRPITHEDVWLMKRVGAPVPSPDGKWVVFTVTEPAYDEKDQVTDLWIVPADGSSQARRLTNTKGAESGVTWTPDSTSVIFAARREGDEANQLYLLNVVQGGEAQRITSLSTGARSPQVSPDGKHVLFQSSVYPGALNDEDNKRIAAERKARKWNARVYETFPIRNWDRWLDDKQTHVFVQPLDANAKAKDLLAGTKLVSEAGFAGAFTSGGDDLQAVWTPDSTGVVFTAMTNRNAAAYSETNTNLYQAMVSGGEPKSLTEGKDSYTSPKYSPDGKTLLSLFEPGTKFTYNISQLVNLSWASQSGKKILVDNLSVSSFAISKDGSTVYFSSESNGFELVYGVPISGRPSGGYKVFTSAQLNGAYTNLAIGGGEVFANWENATHPIEIVRLDGSVYAKPITSFNTGRIAQLDWQPLKSFEFTSTKGRKIQNFIALPPNFDENKKYPLFVVIHGGPHSMWRDQFVLRWNYHLLAAPGYVVLLTNYTGSTGFGEKFAQNIQLDPLKTPGDEINEAADEAIKRFKFIDATKQAAGGASYGGHLANWLQATTTRYKCLISHAGLVNLESQWATSDTIYSRELNNGGPVWEQAETWRTQNPIRRAASFKTPMLLTVGENDFRVPLNNTLENWSVHQRLRIPSKLIVFPEENHWVLKGENSRFFYSEVHAWLARWLK